MGMPIKIRASFNQDANFLERLKAAIEIDPELEADWKRQTVIKINEVVIALRRADAARLERENHAESLAEDKNRSTG